MPPVKVRVKVKVSVGWALQQQGISDAESGRAAVRRAAVQRHLRAEGAGRTLQIHFRPAAIARHAASERKLAAASERVSRTERRAARTIRDLAA